MMYRTVIARAADRPVLPVRPRPYMVVDDDGRLIWMLDGYTTTDRYPYSEPVPGMGNHRNSVSDIDALTAGDVLHE